jgi:hypothetical protein
MDLTIGYKAHQMQRLPTFLRALNGLNKNPIVEKPSCRYLVIDE